MTEPAHTNHLIHETSPYLRQHAHNPVDWHPWGQKALDKACRENKPILLSIGYSACHWCHVMAHESFEDEATAQVMNELFVNIKVDREERPDLDKIYQAAFQMLHRRAGGWPLTMFLTHDDHIPFVGGTYFPNQPRYGMPAFVDILRRVSDHYRQRLADIRQQNQALLEILHGELAAPSATDEMRLTSAPLQAGRDQSVSHFDSAHGGFGGAPKFPHPISLERLLRHWAASLQRGEPDRQAETVVLFTLRKMALGGIYDHLGGGFYRYSVDAEWQIPHFEKMLYDNGPLLALYAQAWRATQDPLFRTVVEETGAWLIREMQSPEGGYYATLDADSEGEEGKFYLWTPEQVRERLTTEEYAAFAVCYGLELSPNFEGHAWHLRVTTEPDELVRRLNVEPTQISEWLAAAQRKLFATRSERIWPGRDEKILTAWNGLAIRGLAIAGRHLGRADFVASAERALDFIHTQLWREGRLLAVYKDGQSRLNAYLDDYAFLIDGILELLQCRWRDGDLDFALALAEVLLDRFEDRQNGGFYFTADDHEALIQRPKPPHDDALPSGNGIAAQVLLKLGHLTGRTRYLEAAERALRWAWPALGQTPNACNTLLNALEEQQELVQTIVLRGKPAALTEWWERCARPYAPRRLTLTIPVGAALPDGPLAEQQPGAATITAYICQGLECQPPVTMLEILEKHLTGTEAAG
ncbi:MAG: thioredoxin domain-containing protein [Candidatus Competibacteraceae bacterium]|nr:thioredoxin domain-containing protein [Candidatus Competibacteraceae bacterium]MCP5125122.1 thioredoxin domain-containing protein [Gammaproteobacteria bacterium]HRX71520.1 thioredoxin domain-containing protein [Candidatus Competibacteraceae bacterium]